MINRAGFSVSRFLDSGPRSRLALGGFLLVGSITAGIDFLLFAYLVSLPPDISAVQTPLEAKIISVSIAIGLAFIGHNFLSFRGKKEFSFTSRVASFLSVYAGAALVQTIVLSSWIDFLDSPDFWSKVLVNLSVISITTVFRFFFSVRIFRRQLRKSPSES
jgi:putative flippase GtrA